MSKLLITAKLLPFPLIGKKGNKLSPYFPLKESGQLKRNIGFQVQYMNFAAPALMITSQQEYLGPLLQKKLAQDLRNNVAQNGAVSSSFAKLD